MKNTILFTYVYTEMYVEVNMRNVIHRQMKSPPKKVDVDFQINIGRTLKNTTKRSAMVKCRIKKAIRVVRRCLVVKTTIKTRALAINAQIKIVTRTICSTNLNF